MGVWGGAFDSADRLVINSPNALAALKNYMKSFQFSNPDRNINSWDAAVAEYCKGDTAMAVFYDSHAMRINDYTRSKVAGNIGSMLIPGGVSVLGGWSLGLNTTGHKKEEAFPVSESGYAANTTVSRYPCWVGLLCARAFISGQIWKKFIHGKSRFRKAMKEQETSLPEETEEFPAE